MVIKVEGSKGKGGEGGKGGRGGEDDLVLRRARAATIPKASADGSEIKAARTPSASACGSHAAGVHSTVTSRSARGSSRETSAAVWYGGSTAPIECSSQHA